MSSNPFMNTQLKAASEDPSFSGGVGNPYLPRLSTSEERVASRGGVGLKAAVVIGVAVVAAYFMWPLFRENPGWMVPAMLGGTVVAIGCVLWARKSPANAVVPAVIFGAVEGVAVSAITGYAIQQFGTGIVFQAVAATVLVVVSMLFLYTSGVIKVTQKFRMVILAATLAAGAYYLLGLVLSMVGIEVPLITSNSVAGIAFTAVMCVIAALGLAVAFDDADSLVQAGAPAKYEWGVAMGLAASIIWLYVELLRLLMKLQSR